MSNEIAIIKRENVELIVSSAPNAYNENQVSHQRCLDAGKKLLDTIHQQGMNDLLDQQVMQFIVKEHNSGKSQSEIVTKLMQSGVDISQIRRVRNKYERQRRQRGLCRRCTP